MRIVTETVEEVGQTPTNVAVTYDGRWGYVTDPESDTVWVLGSDPDGTGWTVGTGIRVGDNPGLVATDLRYAYVVNEGDDTLSMIDLETKQEVDWDGDGNWDRIDVGDATDVAMCARAWGTTSIAHTPWIPTDECWRSTPPRAGWSEAWKPRRSSLSVRRPPHPAPSRTAPKLAVAPTGEKLLCLQRWQISVVQSTRRAATTQLRSADENAALATSPDSLEVVDALDVDGDVTAMEVSPDGRRLYATVVKDGAAELVTYDTTGERLARVDSVAVGADARRVAVSDDGNRAYVTSGERVSVVDLRRRAVVEEVDTRGATRRLAIVPGRDTVLVTDPAPAASRSVRGTFTASTVANPDTARTGEDNSVVINVLANDTDTQGAPLTPAVVRGPASGTATVNANGTITYRPNADFDGTDSFSYTVTGGTSNAAPTTVTVTVTPAITTRLTWNANPRDLDAHLIGPSVTPSGTGFHVYYQSPTYNVDGTTGGTAERAAFLVADDTDGAGPEVIDINTRTPGEYLYYVHKFAGEGDLAASGATSDSSGLP